MKNNIRRFQGYFKSAGLYFFASLFTAVVGIILNPLMAKNLDPFDYAVIGYFTSYNLLLQPLLHCCIITYYARQYYFTPNEKRIDLEHSILLTVATIGFIVLLIFISGFYWLYNTSEHSMPFWPYAFLAFAQVYVNNFSTLYLTKLRITRQAKKYALFSILLCIIMQATTILFVVYLHEGATGKLGSALIVTILFSFYSISKLYHKSHFDKQIAKSALKFGGPLAVAAIFWYFLTGIDRFFLEKINDTTTLGIYNVGASIAAYMTIFYTSISSTFEPDIYKAIAEKKTRKLAAIVVGIIAFTAIANLFFIIVAPFVIDLLTAGRYVNACPYARIFSLHNIAMAMYTSICSVIIGFGYVKQQLVLRIFGAIIAICIYKLLIDSYSFIGAAWGQVLSFTLLFVISLLFLLFKESSNKIREIHNH